jgi:pyruvate carboxylase
MDDNAYLFVYGTLRRAVRHPLHRLMKQQATLIDSGTFRGKLFDLGRYPGTVPSRLSTDRVKGEVYWLNTSGTALEILDQYEGTRFRRKRAAIALDNGREVTAWIYLYPGSVKHRKLIPSGDYVHYLNSF